MADVVIPAIQADIDKFYELSKGDLELIKALFSEMAGAPVPPDQLVALLGIPQEQFVRGQALPSATKDQFANAVKQSVDDGDTPDEYKKVFSNHIARIENSIKVMGEVSAPLKKLWASCNGDLKKIEAFFCDTVPPPNTGKPMPPSMINALLGCPPDATTCTEAQLLACVEKHLDPNDSAEALLTVLAKHGV